MYSQTTAEKLLKEHYLPPVREALNNATVLLRYIDKDSSKVESGGRYSVVPVRKGRNLAAGHAAAENAALLTDGNPEPERSLVRHKYVYSPIRITGQVMRASRTNAMAFVQAVQFNVKSTLEDTKVQVNRQLHGDGTGALAYKTDGTNTSPFDVDDNQGNAFAHLPVGQALNVDVVDADDHQTLLNTGAIPAVLGAETATNFPVTFASGSIAGSADGDYLIVRGAAAGSTLGHELMGLRGVISDVDPPNAGGQLANGLQDLTVAANPFWKAQIVGDRDTKRDLSMNDVQRVLSKIAINSNYSDRDVKLILANYPVRDKFKEVLRNERGYINTMTLDGGVTAISYEGIPVVADHQCDRSTLWFIVPETLAIFQMSDFEWMEDPGSGAILRVVPGFDVYEGMGFCYKNLGTYMRNGNGALVGISE